MSRMKFAHVKDEVTRKVLNGDFSEDAICHALTHTKQCAMDDVFEVADPSLRSAGELEECLVIARLRYALKAEWLWNEEGDAAAAIEALRNAWLV